MHSIKEICSLLLQWFGLANLTSEPVLIPISDTDELLSRRRTHSRGHWPDCH